MDKSFLFVINPISGGIDKGSLNSTIESWGKSSNYNTDIILTTGSGDRDKIREKVHSKRYTAVIAVGGDGTILLCSEVLKDSTTPLGIIPNGSANGMASELDIPTKFHEALSVVERAKIKRIDMLYFNGEEFGLHISDIGLNANLVKNFEENGRRGFLGYASGVLSEIMNLEAFDVTIETESEIITENCYMVAIANAKRYGTGALLNHLGEIDDGLFEICILKKFDITGIAGQFFDQINEDSDHLRVIQCNKARIDLKNLRSFQIDGELKKDTQSVTVSIFKKCLKVIVP